MESRFIIRYRSTLIIIIIIITSKYFIIRSQYLVSIPPPRAGLQVVEQWTHLSKEGLLSPTGIAPTPFRNSASKVAGLQAHATTPGLKEAVINRIEKIIYNRQ